MTNTVIYRLSITTILYLVEYDDLKIFPLKVQPYNKFILIIDSVNNKSYSNNFTYSNSSTATILTHTSVHKTAVSLKLILHIE